MANINIGTAGTTITLTANIFPSPVTFKGFDADDMIEVQEYEAVQMAIGIDKKVSAWTEQMVVTSTITLNPNAPIITEALIPLQSAQKTGDNVIVCTLTVTIPTLNQQWIFADAVLKSGLSIGNLKKRVEPRKFVFASRSPDFFPII